MATNHASVVQRPPTSTRPIVRASSANDQLYVCCRNSTCIETDSQTRNSTATKATLNGWKGSTACGSTEMARTTATTVPPRAMVHSLRAAEVIQRGAGGTAGSANVHRFLEKGEGRRRGYQRRPFVPGLRNPKGQPVADRLPRQDTYRRLSPNERWCDPNGRSCDPNGRSGPNGRNG